MTSKRFVVRPAGGAATLVLTLALGAGLACHADARADSVIYKCITPDGRTEFTDVSKAGCKALDLPGYVSSVPAPRGAGTMRQGAAKAPPATPTNFPRVDGIVQRQRDDERRDILNDELRAEEQKLAALKSTFNDGQPERQGNEKNYAKYQDRVAQMRDDIARSEKNVEALKREIANIH